MPPDVRNQRMTKMNTPQSAGEEADLLIARPRVVFWFRVYAVWLCLAWVAVGYLSWMLGEHGIGDIGGPSTTAAMVAHVLSLLLWALALSVAVLLFSAPQPRHWTLGLVLICLGLLTPITLPASLALIMFWLKPETKAYYGRG
jgi:hypothetical protein